VTIAVSLSGDDSDGNRYRRADDEPNAAAEWFNRVVKSTSAFLETPAARSVLSRFSGPDPGDEEDEKAEKEEEETDGAVVPKLGSFDVMNRTIEVMQASLARYHLAAYPPDVLIEVPRNSSRSLDFHRAADLIEVGRTLAAQSLDSYEAQGELETATGAADGPG
jgi:NTE family protein